MGLRLLKDLTDALSLTPDHDGPARLNETEVPALRPDLMGVLPTLALSPEESDRLLRLVRRYEPYLRTLSAWLDIPLPSWDALAEEDWRDEAPEER